MKKEFTIDRAKWLQAGHPAIKEDRVESQLCDSQGRMCCLGFYLNSCGVAKSAMRRDLLPSDVVMLDSPKEIQWLFEFDVSSRRNESVLASMNDAVGVTQHRREQQIRREFAKQGIKVKFVGEVPK